MTLDYADIKKAIENGHNTTQTIAAWYHVEKTLVYSEILKLMEKKLVYSCKGVFYIQQKHVESAVTKEAIKRLDALRDQIANDSIQTVSLWEVAELIDNVIKMLESLNHKESY